MYVHKNPRSKFRQILPILRLINGRLSQTLVFAAYLYIAVRDRSTTLYLFCKSHCILINSFFYARFRESCRSTYFIYYFAKKDGEINNSKEKLTCTIKEGFL